MDEKESRWRQTTENFMILIRFPIHIHIIKLISRVDDFVSVLRLQMTKIKLHFVVFFLFIEWSENVDKIEIIEKT